jgi:hypothetical protein
MASRRITVTFLGTCLARGVRTLVSRRIGSPFRTAAITVTFPVGTLNLLALTPYISEDETAPAVGPPSGLSLLQQHGQVDYLVGDGEQITLDHQVDVPESGTWLKVYAVNTDFYDHQVNAQIEIDLRPE